MDKETKALRAIYLRRMKNQRAAKMIGYIVAAIAVILGTYVYVYRYRNPDLCIDSPPTQ